MITKKLFFICVMPILLCISLQGSQNELNANIKNSLIVGQKLLFTKKQTPEGVNTMRNDWLSDFKKSHFQITEKTTKALIMLYHNYKKYYLGHNKDKDILITDEIFQEILPTLCSKLDLSSPSLKIKNSDALYAFSDPHLINYFLYDKNLNFLDAVEKRKEKNTFIQGVINFIKISKRKNEKKKPLSYPLIFRLFIYIESGGFFINDVLYKGRSNIFHLNKDIHPLSDDMPCGQQPTFDDIILYTKIAFTPHSYRKIHPKEFPNALKKSFYTLLLCLKRNHPRVKIPTMVWLNAVAPYCERYACAQRIHPKLLEQTRILKELRTTKRLKNTFVNFLCDDFMSWFDEEKLK